MPAILDLLIHKNTKYEFRCISRLVAELVIVVAVSISVVLISLSNAGYFELTSNEMDDTHFSNIHTLDNLDALNELVKKEFQLVYVPNTNGPQTLVAAVTEKLKLKPSKGYTTESLMKSEFDSRYMLAGIAFNNYKDTPTDPHLKITLRFPSLFRTVHDADKNIDLWQSRCTGILTDKDIKKKSLDQDLYLREGFLQVQHALFMSWYKLVAETYKGPFKNYNVTVRSFRHTAHQEHCDFTGSSNFSEFLYSFIFMLPFLTSVWKYARERQVEAPAQHWLFGYNMRRYWFAHFIVSFVRLMIHCAVLTVIVMIPWTKNIYINIFNDLKPLYMVLFLMLYISALILTAMVIAVLMGNARNAVLLAVAIWLSCYGLFALVLEHSNGLQSVYVLMTFIIFFNNAFPYGMRYMHNIRDATSPEEIWILMVVLLINIIVQCMLLDLMLHCKLGRYVDSKPISFCCLYNLYYKRVGSKERVETVTIAGVMPDRRNFEYGPIGAEEYMKLKNVCLNLDKKSKRKLMNISLRVYKGEITVLVGHYGSGKTSLQNILCGWRKPDAGRVCLYKYYIDTDWETARHQIGVVMPENSLFDLLTCAETLKYFVSTKQPADATVENTNFEVNKWLETLKSVIDADQLVCKMTFEQKRLICLCCAMCCDTKIILLDEPVAHMRTKEQRFFFSIMQKEKANRAIFMTTFSIDDAEIVADRIAILIDGFVVAYGSIFFLKNTIGIGCDLIIIKDKTTSTEAITEIVARHFPYITPDNEIGNQITYKIPAAKRTVFQRMLLQLEEESKHLGLQDIRLLSSELSEIYESLDKKKNKQVISENTKQLKVTYVSQRELSRQQFYAMLYKKMLHQAPNVIPFVLAFASVVLICYINKLAVVLRTPPLHNFTFGLKTTANSRALFKGYDNCKFIAMKIVEKSWAVHKLDASSRVFHKSSFDCEKVSFEDYISTTKTIVGKLGAIEVDEATNSAVVWINQHIFHSAAITLNLLHNYILERTFPDNTDIFTTITSDPMSIPLQVKIHLDDQHLTHLRLPLTVGIVIPITVSTFIFPLVEERNRNFLILQVLAGLRMDIYWIVNFIWDFFTYLAFMGIYIFAMSLMVLEGFDIFTKTIILLLLLIYGVAALLMTYFISIFFSKSIIRAFLVSVIIQLLTGLCAYVFYWDVIRHNSLFFYLASLSPTFSLLDGISNLYAGGKEHEYCMSECADIENCSEDNLCMSIPQCCFNTYFKIDDPGILLSIIYMSLSAMIFAFLIFMVELHRDEQRYHTPKEVRSLRSACYPYDDVNVVKMRKQIAEADMRQHRGSRFVVDQLENFIPKNDRKLNTVSFVVNKHECLGIFGTRKCGKSHLARQLVGADGFRFGEIYVLGMEMKYELYDINKITGYCPQIYGYINCYKIRELMHILCLIRGVPPVLIPDIISEIALSLDIKRIVNRRIGTLNMDQRRKVNIAAAFIAYNKVVVFDEPTRGLSPHTRREVWNVLRYARYCGKTLIFTTSDIEECGMLADHTILFEDGEMLGLDSIYKMRNKYTLGFYLEVKISRDGSSKDDIESNLNRDLENLKRFVSFLHQRSELIRQIDTIYKFYVPVEKVTFSYLYGALEKNRRRLNIIEYIVTQGNMSDVLHNITARRTHKKKYPKK